MLQCSASETFGVTAASGFDRGKTIPTSEQLPPGTPSSLLYRYDASFTPATSVHVSLLHAHSVEDVVIACLSRWGLFLAVNPSWHA